MSIMDLFNIILGLGYKSVKLEVVDMNGKETKLEFNRSGTETTRPRKNTHME